MELDTIMSIRLEWSRYYTHQIGMKSVLFTPDWIEVSTIYTRLEWSQYYLHQIGMKSVQ